MTVQIASPILSPSMNNIVDKPIELLEHRLCATLETKQISVALLVVRYSKESTGSKLLEVQQLFSKLTLVVQAQQFLDKRMEL